MGFVWLLILIFGQLAIKNTGTLDFESDGDPEIYNAVNTPQPPAQDKDAKTGPLTAHLEDKELSLLLEHEAENSGAMKHSDGERAPQTRIKRRTRQVGDTEEERSYEVSDEPKASKNSRSGTEDGQEVPSQPWKPDTVAQNGDTTDTRPLHKRSHALTKAEEEAFRALFAIPDFARFDEDCPGDPSARHLKGSDERIEWKESKLPSVLLPYRKSSVCTWLIDVGPQYGIVLQFLTVSLQRGDTRDKADSLTVYRYQQDKERELRRVEGNMPVPPVVEHTNRVLVRLVTHQEAAAQGHGHTCTDDRSVRLGYKRYLLQELPPEVRKGRYNCSAPYIVPEALRCDMAKQCINGEDELNYSCTYHEPHCEKGTVFGSFHNMSYCLKLYDPGRPVSGRRIPEGCTLGYFPDPDSRRLAATLVAMAGYEEAYVDFTSKAVRASQKPFYHYARAWRTHNGQFFDFTQSQTQLLDPDPRCAVLRVSPYVHALPSTCDDGKLRPFLCRRDITRNLPPRKSTIILTPASQKLDDKFPVKSCPDGTFVHPFHFCESDVYQATWSLSNLPLLHCRTGRRVHYSLSCDGVNDCSDSTDEEAVRCRQAAYFAGDYKAIIKNGIFCDEFRYCDGRFDCIEGGDEEDCSDCQSGFLPCLQQNCVPYTYVQRGLLTCHTQNTTSDVISSSQSRRLHKETSSQNIRCSQPDINHTRRRLDFDGYGLIVLTELAEGEACPETHFQCTISLCVPSFLVKNGKNDCPWPYADDEGVSGGDLEVTCSGYYRCYAWTLCIHPDYLCDGIYHCPLKDDERYCNMTCPQNCTCEGYAYTCQLLYDSARYPKARYLDLGGSKHLPYTVHGKHLGFFIQFLNLSSTGLNRVDLLSLTILRVLDLSHNHLDNWTAIRFPQNSFLLTHVNLSNNPFGPELDNELADIVQKTYMVELVSLNLDNCGIRHFTKNSFKGLERLTHLSMKNNGIKSVPESIFHGLKKLQRLDIRGNRLGLTNRNVFKGLQNLHILKTDDQSSCCLYFHLYPDSPTRIAKCVAPEDELSSCSDLLRSDFYRVCLWVFSLLAILGNMGVLVYRLCLEAEGSSSGFRVLVANLCGSDFLMGVYLMMIGSADAYYRGQYVWKRETWTHSAVCQAAGFLALVSSEVSAFMICIITLDRLLVLQFPFKHHLHLTWRSAAVACSAAWLTGIVLATLPLLPATGWKFYTQTGICLPLPVTRLQFPGKQYAFGTFIVLNLILFVLIGIGQVFIYRAVRSTPLADRTQRRQQDMAIAHRLFLIVFSDFCCWIPVGVLGLLASLGTPIPGEVNVGVAVFVLPLNSAINPFLYTLNMLLERRRKRKREERLQTMMGRLHVEMSTWSTERLHELVQHGERLRQRRVETQRPGSEEDHFPVAGPETSGRESRSRDA